MSLNININFGGGGNHGCMNGMNNGFPGMGGMGGFPGMGGMGGFPGMGGIGGFPGMGGMGGGFQNPMMQMMQMMQMLMTLMQGMGAMGGGGMPMGGGGGFGGGCPSGGGNPIGDFLGNGGGGGGNYNNGGGNYNNGGGNYNNGNSSPVSGNQGVQGNGSGNSTVQIARQFLGQNSRDVAGRMGPFSAAGGNTNNCADFVSSALVASGRLRRKNVNCRSLERQLQQEGWRQIPADQARPGDVAFNQSRGHVQLCQGNGRQIGSNNVRQGFQKITEGNMMRNSVVYTKG